MSNSADTTVRIVPIAGVHSLELHVTPDETVARLLTNGVPNSNYQARPINLGIEIKRLQDALRGGPAIFAKAMATRV